MANHGNQFTTGKLQTIYLMSKMDPHTRWFYDNCHVVAGGKCDRCKAPDCRDRDWKARGMEAPF